MDYYTKEQRAEYNKRYREEHKEQIRISRKKYYMKNAEKEIAYAKRWIENNRARFNELQRKYRGRKALEGQI